MMLTLPLLELDIAVSLSTRAWGLASDRSRRTFDEEPDGNPEDCARSAFELLHIKQLLGFLGIIGFLFFFTDVEEASLLVLLLLAALGFFLDE